MTLNVGWGRMFEVAICDLKALYQLEVPFWHLKVSQNVTPSLFNLLPQISGQDTEGFTVFCYGAPVKQGSFIF